MARRRPSGDGMVRKRDDGRWEGRIVVGHKENGDSIFRYVYADNQKELTAKLRQNIDAYQGIDLTEQSRMTLGCSARGPAPKCVFSQWQSGNSLRPQMRTQRISQSMPCRESYMEPVLQLIHRITCWAKLIDRTTTPIWSSIRLERKKL